MKKNLTCGSCLFLNRDRIFEKKCSELGKLPSSKCCASHTPDAFQLAGSPGRVDRLKLIAQAIHGMSISDLQALAAVLCAEKTTRKFGWRFYQRVVVRYTGGAHANYFSNFAVGYVVHADKENIRIVGDSGKMMITAINDKDSHTVYTLDRFRALSASMSKEKHFVDPEMHGVCSGVARAKPLDDALASDAPVSKKLKVSKTKTDDLVSIISKMSRGFEVRSSRRGSQKSDRRSGEITMDWRS